jgi:2',3'-cyclic-nucleotide 2'-phosphodiesterase (5'-nucleotidase family)
MGLWLRIIQINDVYELCAFPNLATLIQEHSKNESTPSLDDGGGPDRTLVFCAGDFLAPSLLSSLDKGAGMVDCLEAVGITLVCIGNHEADVGDAALAERIRSSKFVWVNTNIPTLNDALGAPVRTIPHDVIEISNGTLTKKVGILGILTDDTSLYLPGSFGSANIEPILPFTEAYLPKLQSQVDLIVPMTHQGMAKDRLFAQHFGGSVFSVILGGHDHEVFDETHNGSRVLKTGQDATNATVIDIQWKDKHATTLDVSVRMLPTRDYAPDPTLAKRVQAHHKILHELEQSPLFCVKSWMPSPGEAFSTRNNRLRPTTGSTALATILRMGMRAQCTIVNAGSIRASADYDPDSYFTWSDLESEIPFPTGMVACYVPGLVIEAAITHS